MQDIESLDEIRQRLQESLKLVTREQLRDEYGMLYDRTDPRLSPETQQE